MFDQRKIERVIPDIEAFELAKQHRQMQRDEARAQ
jgi:hypothetical protein